MLFSTPLRAALVSVTSNTFLVAIKLAVALASGSVALLSEALHSSLNLLAALIAWISLRFAAHPPDREHPCLIRNEGRDAETCPCPLRLNITYPLKGT